MKNTVKSTALFLLIIVLFTNCSEENEVGIKAIDLVTGILLTDVNAQFLAEYGNPNQKHLNVTSLFPNPTNGLLNLNSIGNTKKIWVIKANNAKFPEVDFEKVYENFEYSIDDISSTAILNQDVPSSSNQIQQLQFDFSNTLTTGYYRLFMQHEDNSLSWLNFYFDPNISNAGDIWDQLYDDWD